jgi:membrane-associated PAP2 superfamily phosphatase
VLWLALLGFLPLIVLLTVPGVDLALSAYFYNAALPQTWYLAATPPWRWLYLYGEYPALALAGGSLLVLLAGLVRPSWAGYRRRCVFLVCAVALGPGLLVNGILKPTWDRARPRHIAQFGGLHTYRPWWQPGTAGRGDSFPSGHAAMGYILVAAAALVPGQRRWQHRLALGGAFGFGTLLGLTRLVQGGHFASDVVWAGALMCGTVLVLQKALGIAPDPPRRAPSAVVPGAAQRASRQCPAAEPGHAPLQFDR